MWVGDGGRIRSEAEGILSLKVQGRMPSLDSAPSLRNCTNDLTKKQRCPLSSHDENDPSGVPVVAGDAASADVRLGLSCLCTRDVLIHVPQHATLHTLSDCSQELLMNLDRNFQNMDLWGITDLEKEEDGINFCLRGFTDGLNVHVMLSTVQGLPGIRPCKWLCSRAPSRTRRVVALISFRVTTCT